MERDSTLYLFEPGTSLVELIGNVTMNFLSVGVINTICFVGIFLSFSWWEAIHIAAH